MIRQEEEAVSAGPSDQMDSLQLPMCSQGTASGTSRASFRKSRGRGGQSKAEGREAEAGGAPVPRHPSSPPGTALISRELVSELTTYLRM